MKWISDITVEPIQQMGSDAMLAGAAWVSTNADAAYDKAAESPEAVPRVISYLMKHRHGTPFEHGALTVNTHCPIFVYREWHRHRIGFSYNEESARYKTLDPVFYVPPRSRPMIKVDNWKAGRPKFMTLEEAYPGETQTQLNSRYLNFISRIEASNEQAYNAYLDGLHQGFDPGIARAPLPVNIYSSQWVTLNPRSCMSFLSLRQHHLNAKFVSYPLWEINQAANRLEEIFKEYWPITWEAYEANGRVAP